MRTFIALFGLAILVSSCVSPEEPIPVKRYAWVVGDADSTGYGAIYHTTDGGVTFSRQGVGQEVLKGINVLDVKALDRNTVWATCSANTVVTTTDGGITWSAVPMPANNPDCELYCISTFGTNTIVVSGSHGTVYISDNGGASWRKSDVPGMTEAQFQGVVALSDSRAYICGNIPVTGSDDRIGVIRQTTDGGDTWQPVDLPNRFDSIHTWISAASYGSSIMIYGTTNYYSLSSDNGATWRNDSTNIRGGGGGADINHLIMLSPTTWMAAFDMGHLMRTDDAGISWIDVRPGLGAAFMLGISAFDNTYAIACGETSNAPQLGHIVYTTDGGQSWMRSFTKTKSFRKVTTVF